MNFVRVEAKGLAKVEAVKDVVEKAEVVEGREVREVPVKAGEVVEVAVEARDVAAVSGEVPAVANGVDRAGNAGAAATGAAQVVANDVRVAAEKVEVLTDLAVLDPARTEIVVKKIRIQMAAVADSDRDPARHAVSVPQAIRPLAAAPVSAGHATRMVLLRAGRQIARGAATVSLDTLKAC